MARAALAMLAAFLACGNATPAPAGPAQPANDGEDEYRQPWQSPTLTTERYNENWSALADPANRTGRWTEAFKYIPLDHAGAVYLTTGIELRLRNEDYAGQEWGGGGVPDQGYLWLRALPYADLHVGHLRAFAQPVASYAIGVKPAPSPVDRTRLDMLQLFAAYTVSLGANAKLRLSAGRQLVGLGAERLVGTRYGPNTPRAFDGARATIERGAMQVNGFYLLPVDARPGNFDDRRSRSQALWGVYATQALGRSAQARLEVYYLGYRNDQGSFQQGMGREVRQTLGLRSAGKAGTVHWDAEAMLQFGRFAGAPIHAWSLSLKAGKAFPNMPLHPDVDMHVDIVSGDRNPANPALQTFNPLFPKGKYFGELSPIGPYNIIDTQASLSLDLGHSVDLGLATMAYWRQSGGDGVYDVPGHLLRAGTPGQARFIGKQAELGLSWQATPELNLSGAVGAFIPGPFLRESGAHRAIRMAEVEANFRF